MIRAFRVPSGAAQYRSGTSGTGRGRSRVNTAAVSSLSLHFNGGRQRDVSMVRLGWATGSRTRAGFVMRALFPSRPSGRLKSSNLNSVLPPPASRTPDVPKLCPQDRGRFELNRVSFPFSRRKPLLLPLLLLFSPHSLTRSPDFGFGFGASMLGFASLSTHPPIHPYFFH